MRTLTEFSNPAFEDMPNTKRGEKETNVSWCSLLFQPRGPLFRREHITYKKNTQPPLPFWKERRGLESVACEGVTKLYVFR